MQLGRGAGRREAVKALRAALVASVAGGSPSVLVLTAPPGAGKSHTLRLVSADLPVRTCWATADELSSRRPYAAGAVLLDLSLPERPPPDTDRLLLDRVDEMVADGPVLLVLDDAHLADAATLSVLAQLAAATADLPLTLLLARCPEPGRDQLERLVDRPGAGEVRLPPMDGVDLDVVVRERTGSWPGPRLRSLLAATQGSPLHAVGLVDALRRQVALVDVAPEVVDVADGAAVADVASMAELVRDGIDSLRGRPRDVLRWLAVWGGPALIDDLAEVAHVDPVTLVEPVQELLDADVVAFDGAERLRFTQGSYVDLVYDAIPGPLRRVLHDAVAKAATSTERPRHLIGAGASVDEVVGAVRDAERDLVDAPGVAADLFGDAVAATGSDRTAAVEMAVGRARALARSGQMSRAEETARAGLAATTDPVATAELRRVLIFAASNRGDVAAALAMVDETLGGPGVPERVRQVLGDHRRYLSVLGGTGPVPLEPFATDPRELTLTGLVAESLRCFLVGHPHRAIEYAAEASRLHMSAGLDPFEGRSGDVWPPFVEMHVGGPDTAAATLREVEARRETRQAAWQVAPHQLIAAAIVAASGRLDDAAAQYDAALELADSVELGWTSLAIGNRVQIDVLRGRVPQAEERLQAWRLSGVPHQFGLPVHLRAEASILEASRRHREAAAVARDLWTDLLERRCYGWLPTVAPDLARLALLAADRDLASAIVAGLDQVPRPLSPVAQPAVDLARALCVLPADEIADAAASAARAAIAVGDVLLAAQAWEEASVAAALGGDRDAARGLAREALAIAADAGAVGLASRVTSRLRAAGVRLGATAGRRRPTTGWASLTPTEARVAELVGTGASGPQIASQLFISPRTVQTHVSHALAKLGLASRTELAAAVATRLATS